MIILLKAAIAVASLMSPIFLLLAIGHGLDHARHKAYNKISRSRSV